jgi:transposase
MKQHPADFRDRLLRAIDAGLARAEAARRFGVHEKTIARWQRRRRELGSAAPLPRRGPPPKVPPERHAALAAQVRAHQDATLAEHCARWAAEQGGRGASAPPRCRACCAASA